MRAPLRLRNDDRGFSAFYGAFAVLLAATLVVGAIAANGPRGDLRFSDDRLAHEFLEALLASTVPSANTSGGQALAVTCFAPSCDERLSAGALLEWLAALAESLAAPLGLEFLLVLSAAQFEDAQAGSLEPRPGLPMSHAEVFNPSVAGFVALSLFLGTT